MFLLKLATFIFSLSALTSYFTSDAFGQFVLFHDDFNDGDAAGWSIPRNTCTSSWQMNSFSYGIIINSPCITETIPTTLSIPPGASYSFEVDVTMATSANMDRNFVFKYLNSSNWYGIHTLGNNLYLHKVVNGTEYFLQNWHVSYPFLDNETYRFKVLVTPNIYYVFVNGVLVSTVLEDGGPVFSNSSAGLQASSGGIPTSQVWFDNVIITGIVPPSPTPSPTPSPLVTNTPTPIITPSITHGPFELPINYTGRLSNNEQIFKNAFWSHMNATFDHVFKQEIFIPFTGNYYTLADCPEGVIGISCYDSHNGVDFSRKSGNSVYSVADGVVTYTSSHEPGSTCTPDRGGFGCVIIIHYPNVDTYALYAHLSEIYVNSGDLVNSSSLVGLMGNTGCPNCGIHLHFSSLLPTNPLSSTLARIMTRKDWQTTLYQVNPKQTQRYRPFCTYRSPNGAVLSFQDPSGWGGNGTDPWSLLKKDGGCGIISSYLWKYSVGTTP
jgi:murein DD-endopeptidase MepM/ murein hydrolase activator NlpD